MTKNIETQHYPRIGAQRILLAGFQECPKRALREVAAGAFIFACLFAALHLKEILMWIGRALG